MVSRSDFACPCCGENRIRDDVVLGINRALVVLEQIWHEVPIIITSGYRCEKHNKEIGGSPHSLHLVGLAVDSRPLLPPHASQTAREHALRWWAIALIRAGFTRIGQTFPGKLDGQVAIHADMGHIIGKPPQFWAPFQNMQSYGKYLYYFRWGEDK